jgi:glycosyltransferase involved in cell wall biosynthesis
MGLQDAPPVPVEVIENALNRGFQAAINQGLREARGEHLVLTNVDVVVTDGWLEQLRALTEVRVDGEEEETFGPEHGGVWRPAPNNAAFEIGEIIQLLDQCRSFRLGVRTAGRDRIADLSHARV